MQCYVTFQVKVYPYILYGAKNSIQSKKWSRPSNPLTLFGVSSNQIVLLYMSFLLSPNALPN